MASILSGIAKTLSGGEKRPTAHSQFVEGELIPAVQRLQKELGWRRYKVCIFCAILLAMVIGFLGQHSSLLNRAVCLCFFTPHADPPAILTCLLGIHYFEIAGMSSPTAGSGSAAQIVSTRNLASSGWDDSTSSRPEIDQYHSCRR